MLRFQAALAIAASLALTASCGDKLDPVTADPSDETASSNPNETVAAASNANSTATTPTASTGSSTTAPASGTTTPSTGTTSTPTATTLCGTTSTSITYTNQASKLITSACLSCHDAGGNNPTLSTYAKAEAAFKNGGAQDQVDQGSMPQGRTLTSNELCIFDAWMSNNYAE